MGWLTDLADLIAEDDPGRLGIDPHDPQEKRRRAVRPPLRRRSIVVRGTRLHACLMAGPDPDTGDV